MINFEFIEKNRDALRVSYLTAKPFPHLLLKDFCDREKLLLLYEQIPLLESKSRDYIFAGNKFEKSNYPELGPLFNELYEDFRSQAMTDFLSYLSGKETFVDPENHGGGLHQGRKNSFLDMHLDYNYHPISKNWWREMNLLLYLNKDWKEEYGGKLKLRDLRTNEEKELNVDFNTLIIQKCDDYTLHGYDQTNFPENVFRTSIATYAFTLHANLIYSARTTDWFPSEDASGLKTWLGRNTKHFVKLKAYFFGSGTARNR